MREIKFRLWSKIDKKFIINDNPDVDFAINTDGFLYSIQYDNGETSVLLQTDTGISLYTGVKDKNSKEIFEGDLVKLLDTINETVCQVKYHHGRYILENRDFVEDLSNCEDRFLKVVGNIYENRELLEEKE